MLTDRNRLANRVENIMFTLPYETLFVDALAPLGFVKEPLSRQGLYFYRRMPEGYYRGVLIDASRAVRTQKLNYVAYAVVSELNVGYLLKGLCEMRLIQRIANIPGTGQAELATEEAAQGWAAKLVDCLEEEIRVLESECLATLRERTHEAREAAFKYLNADLPVTHDPRSEKIARRARLLSALEEQYVDAANILLSRKAHVEPDVEFDMENPLFGNPCMHRLQFLVDGLRRGAPSAAAG